MGCIVNGPGEMADADFGYVGGAPGKIDLYVGKVSTSHFFFFFSHIIFRQILLCNAPVRRCSMIAFLNGISCLI